MSRSSQAGQALPNIPVKIGPIEVHAGDTLTLSDENWERLITNGPATMIYFTDQIGDPILGSPRCAQDPSHTPLRLCDVALQLSSNKNAFWFTGTISAAAKPGTYTFYIRVENIVGKSKVCKCEMRVAVRPRPPSDGT